MGASMSYAELDAVTKDTSCAVERRGRRGMHAAHCENPFDKVIVLRRLAELDVRRDPRVRQIAARLMARAARTLRGAAEVFHAYVRDTVPFVPEEIETFRPTMITLKSGGDCDDSARALMALCIAAGLPVRYATLDKSAGGRSWPAHIACQIYDGTAWQWAETTLKGARLGEHPRAALLRLDGPGARAGARTDISGIDMGELAEVKCATLSTDVDRAARDAVLDAWSVIVTAPKPTLAAVQYVQAVCRLETTYGRGWVAPGHAHLKSSHNWGAVQCPKSPVVDLFAKSADRPRPTLADVDATGITCPPNCALGYDTKTSGMFYAVCFRTYVDDAAGAFDVLKEIFKRPLTRAALAQTDTTKISAAMYDEHYYGGFGATREERIDKHAAAIDCNVKAIAAAQGERIAVKRGGVGLAAVATSNKAIVGLGIVAAAAGSYYAYENWPKIKRTLGL